MATWAQLGLHTKPFGLLDVAGFYEQARRVLRSRGCRGIHPSATPRDAARVRRPRSAPRRVRRVVNHRPCTSGSIATRRRTRRTGYGQAMMRSKKKWSDLTPQQRAGVLGLVALQAALAAFAQRDLGSRSADELRGPKLLWRFATLNTFGAIAYLTIGPGAPPHLTHAGAASPVQRNQRTSLQAVDWNDAASSLVEQGWVRLEHVVDRGHLRATGRGCTAHLDSGAGRGRGGSSGRAEIRRLLRRCGIDGPTVRSHDLRRPDERSQGRPTCPVFQRSAVGPVARRRRLHHGTPQPTGGGWRHCDRDAAAAEPGFACGEDRDAN